MLLLLAHILLEKRKDILFFQREEHVACVVMKLMAVGSCQEIG